MNGWVLQGQGKRRQIECTGERQEILSYPSGTSARRASRLVKASSQVLKLPSPPHSLCSGAVQADANQVAKTQTFSLDEGCLWKLIGRYPTQCLGRSGSSSRACIIARHRSALPSLLETSRVARKPAHVHIAECATMHVVCHWATPMK